MARGGIESIWLRTSAASARTLGSLSASSKRVMAAPPPTRPGLRRPLCERSASSFASNSASGFSDGLRLEAEVPGPRRRRCGHPGPFPSTARRGPAEAGCRSLPEEKGHLAAAMRTSWSSSFRAAARAGTAIRVSNLQRPAYRRRPPDSRIFVVEQFDKNRTGLRTHVAQCRQCLASD